MHICGLSSHLISPITLLPLWCSSTICRKAALDHDAPTFTMDMGSWSQTFFLQTRLAELLSNTSSCGQSEFFSRTVLIGLGAHLIWNSSEFLLQHRGMEMVHRWLIPYCSLFFAVPLSSSSDTAGCSPTFCISLREILHKAPVTGWYTFHLNITSWSDGLFMVFAWIL